MLSIMLGCPGWCSSLKFVYFFCPSGLSACTYGRTGGCQVIKYVCIYGIKVSFWGSGTLKIAIYVENYPQK